MTMAEDLYKIGKIGKPHGVKGEVSFHFSDDVFDRTEAEYLMLCKDGLMVPFFMEEYRFRSDETALVKFCDIDTQERASELTGCEVFFPRDVADDDDDNLSWAEIIGYSLIDSATSKNVGKIASVDDSTINILFELEDGTLIPASIELITNVDKKHKEIEIELPDGILDL
ncbi:MAG: 16S rRNA processing protein RimM [Prevotella sp.]|nr:16S rRNA processing protein RimM [Prevotella sp.]